MKTFTRKTSLLIIIFLLMSGYILSNNFRQPDPTKREFFTQVAATVEKHQEIYPITLEAELTTIAETNTTPIPTASINSENWLQMWLSSPTCRPPCWENIIPEQTEYNTAARIIASIPGINIETLSLTPALIDNMTAIKWNFGQNGSGHVKASHKDRIVKHILLTPRDNNAITVGELIRSFGEPDSVATDHCFGEFFSVSCAYKLLYRKLGMTAHLTVFSNESNRINIKRETPISYLTLSSPEEMMSFENTDATLFELPWSGYKIYEFHR